MDSIGGERNNKPSPSSMTTTGTHLQDLPEPILSSIFSLISDVRSRNSASLASKKCYSLERSTRSSLSLRGNSRDLFLLPTCFSSSVSHLDLSLLSPWGHPFLHQSHDHGQRHEHHHLFALRLRQSFPDLTSLTLYARSSSALRALLAPHWPSLRRVGLVRWHQRPPNDPPGADLDAVFHACPGLRSLDLTRFYFWTEDVPAALQAHPLSATSLTGIDLISHALTDGFRSSELVSIASACPSLERLRAPCVFNPMHFDFVGDDAIDAIGSRCPRIALLHLVDPAASIRGSELEGQESKISRLALERLFLALPRLEDLALDLCHDVRNAGPALEVLANRCPKMKSLKLGHFQGICRAAGLHLDGVAVCGGLESLCIRNSSDLTDSSLVAIARGCSRISRFELYRCDNVTEGGIKRMAGMLRSTLVDVKISACRCLNAAASLRALAPIIDRIERLHIDCVWAEQESEEMNQSSLETESDESDDNEVEQGQNGMPNKRRKFSYQNGGSHGFWSQSWDRLRYLSLWLPAGELLSPLPVSGLYDCPVLEEVAIKIEGDCRTRPTQPVFGLSCLSRYPRLSKMKLDCGDAIGYALTAPMDQMDLSVWERFYLHGIGSLKELYELDYWPPQDREVNQRSLSLPAAGLIQGCLSLRKLFIHGTAHEHFMRFFIQMPMLRDVQLREDYYPAPENDMSTEMRVDSCIRFEDALNSRHIPD